MIMQRRPVKKSQRISWTTRVILGIIIVLVGLSIWILSPSGSSTLDRDKGDLGLRLGLDLKGGTQLLYQVEFPENMTDPDEQQRQLDASINTIENRVNKLGVVEPVIQKQGDDKILVQLPGITDIDQAKSLVEEAAFLEFREVERNSSNVTVTLENYLATPPSTYYDSSVTGSRYFYAQSFASPLDPVAILAIQDGVPTYKDINGNVITDTTTLDQSSISWMPSTGTLKVNGEDTQVHLIGGYLSKASALISQNPPFEVSIGIELNSDGVTIFNQIAPRLNDRTGVQKQLGIILDSQMISSPSMNVTNADGGLSITGSFTTDEANTLSIQLTSGALTIKLVKPLLYEDNVSATMGTDFIHRSTLAGVVGLLAVILFMILYYRGLGLVASLSLLIYTVLVLAIYKWIPVTLTLAGIGAFVVSLGMSVDANVLIFERMKEELRSGRTISSAIEVGFSRAWSAIGDSNITTFIACAVLYWFGSHIVANSQVKGFAITLAIGVAVSMFTAITVTHMLLRISTTSETARRILLPKPGKKEETKI